MNEILDSTSGSSRRASQTRTQPHPYHSLELLDPAAQSHDAATPADAATAAAVAVAAAATTALPVTPNSSTHTLVDASPSTAALQLAPLPPTSSSSSSSSSASASAPAPLYSTTILAAPLSTSANPSVANANTAPSLTTPVKPTLAVAVVPPPHQHSPSEEIYEDDDEDELDILLRARNTPIVPSPHLTHGLGHSPLAPASPLALPASASAGGASSPRSPILRVWDPSLEEEQHHPTQTNTAPPSNAATFGDDDAI